MSTAARAVRLSAQQVRLLSHPLLDSSVDALLDSLAGHPPRLTAQVLSSKRVPEGAGVSYGHTFRTESETTLALVAIGYGHGIPRKAGNRASVTWGPSATRMPIVGRVAMDVLVVDAGDATIAAGDEVVFFGDPAERQVPLEEWAASVSEHPFSILASLDERVNRLVA